MNGGDRGDAQRNEQRNMAESVKRIEVDVNRILEFLHDVAPGCECQMADPRPVDGGDVLSPEEQDCLVSATGEDDKKVPAYDRALEAALATSREHLARREKEDSEQLRRIADLEIENTALTRRIKALEADKRREIQYSNQCVRRSREAEKKVEELEVALSAWKERCLVEMENSVKALEDIADLEAKVSRFQWFMRQDQICGHGYTSIDISNKGMFCVECDGEREEKQGDNGNGA